MVLFNGFSSAVLKHIIFICEKVEKVKRWKIKQKGESFNLWPRASNGCESQEKAWLGRERERERERESERVMVVQDVFLPERAMPDIKLLFFRTLLDWFSVWRNHRFSILDLLDFCNFRSWLVLPCILPVCFGVSFLNSMNSYYLSKNVFLP